MAAPAAWHALPGPAVLAALDSRPDGLVPAEVAARLARHGPNTLPADRRRSWAGVFAAQFRSPMIYLLFAAAALAALVGQSRDAGVILVVVVVNAIIGAAQEGRAGRSMEALRRLSALRVRVRRDGREQEVEAAALVPGDILSLAAGDAVGADARLLETAALEAAEAALTGESVPVAKVAAALREETLLGERHNLVYAGTHLTAGRGRGQMDPPREEVGAALAACRHAGIRPVMVTGDHQATGLALARQLGLAREDDRAVDGRELERMSDPELRAALGRIAVFARVLPAQKLRIVEAFQAGGAVVAMTGDGVNDAPALARADVGVAMGVGGTEVAKGAAEIVVTDHNFATIVHAVEQGRLVYANVQKLLLFLLATSLDEVVVLLGALLLGVPLPLLAVQILWINIVSEGTLTVNLVMEGPEGDEMRRPPVPVAAPLIGRGLLRRLAVMVPASAAATLGYYLWRLSTEAPLELVRTETFTVLAVCQWFNALNCESPTRSALRFDVWRNKWLLGGLVLANLFQGAVVYLEPMNRLFHTVPIPFAQVLLIGAVASVTLWAEESRKFFARRNPAAYA